jgi:hypothetical protein
MNNGSKPTKTVRHHREQKIRTGTNLIIWIPDSKARDWNGFSQRSIIKRSKAVTHDRTGITLSNLSVEPSTYRISGTLFMVYQGSYYSRNTKMRILGKI